MAARRAARHQFMNAKRKYLTITALMVFAITVLFARWDLSSPVGDDGTARAPTFAPPELRYWHHRELATSNYATWLAIGVIYAGLFALLGEAKATPTKKPDE